MPTVDDLARIAANGGGLILDGSRYAVDDLARIASNAKALQALIVIRNTNRFGVDDMARIAANGGGCVVFDFLTN